MKVLKGFYKGVELANPNLEAVRPTVDHLKKHIVKIAEELKPRIVWDLFAGTGGVGIEFLSLGAEQAVFVEQLNRALACLQLNLAECRLKNPDQFSKQQTQVVSAPVEGFLKSTRTFGIETTPDLVFLDPPYGQGFMKKIVPLLLANEVCSQQTYFLAEHVVDDPVILPEGLATLVNSQVYGPKMLTLFRKS